MEATVSADSVCSSLGTRAQRFTPGRGLDGTPRLRKLLVLRFICGIHVHRVDRVVSAFFAADPATLKLFRAVNPMLLPGFREEAAGAALGAAALLL